jgi:hypothetical protein
MPTRDDGGKGGDMSTWHNIALLWAAFMARFYLHITLGLKGRVTMDLGKGGRTANAIPHANKDGKGRKPGHADLIFWGEDIIYVWEVKPNSKKELDSGREQLNRYIEKLRAKLGAAGDHRRVQPGPWLPPLRGIKVGNGKVLDVWSDARRPGMVIYGSKDAPRESPPSGPVRQPVPVPMPQPAPRARHRIRADAGQPDRQTRQRGGAAPQPGWRLRNLPRSVLRAGDQARPVPPRPAERLGR